MSVCLNLLVDNLSSCVNVCVSIKRSGSVYIVYFESKGISKNIFFAPRLLFFLLPNPKGYMLCLSFADKYFQTSNQTTSENTREKNSRHHKKVILTRSVYRRKKKQVNAIEISVSHLFQATVQGLGDCLRTLPCLDHDPDLAMAFDRQLFLSFAAVPNAPRNPFLKPLPNLFTLHAHQIL